MSFPELSILIPAAGASARLGQAKQLVKRNGITLIQNAVNLANVIQPREIIVVTGANEQLVMDAVPSPPVNWVHNPDWFSGMGGSIAVGAATIKPDSSGLMVLLCDQWRLGEQDLRKLAQIWQSHPQHIITAEVDGHYTPPVIFPESCFTQLQSLRGIHGARSVLKTQPDLIKAVTLSNAAYDLDTKAQLDELNKSPS